MLLFSWPTACRYYWKAKAHVSQRSNGLLLLFLSHVIVKEAAGCMEKVEGSGQRVSERIPALSEHKSIKVCFDLLVYSLSPLLCDFSQTQNINLKMSDLIKSIQHTWSWGCFRFTCKYNISVTTDRHCGGFGWSTFWFRASLSFNKLHRAERVRVCSPRC